MKHDSLVNTGEGWYEKEFGIDPGALLARMMNAGARPPTVKELETLAGILEAFERYKGMSIADKERASIKERRFMSYFYI